jgi:hypothetical protein
MHQKHPPANVASACPGGTVTVVAAMALGGEHGQRELQQFPHALLLSMVCVVAPGAKSLHQAPEPRGAAHAARIAVHRRHEAGAHLVGENMRAPQARNVRVQRAMFDSPPPDDHVGSSMLITPASERARRAS